MKGKILSTQRNEITVSRGEAHLSGRKGMGELENVLTAKTQRRKEVQNLIKSVLRKQDFFMIAREITIRGKVHGVFFRASAKAKADEYGLYGWVKNEPDESVVIWVEGPESKVMEMIDWCWRGSERARVKDVSVIVVELAHYKDFTVIQ